MSRSALQFDINRRLLAENYTWCAVQYCRFTWSSVARSIGVSRYTCLLCDAMLARYMPSSCVCLC